MAAAIPIAMPAEEDISEAAGMEAVITAAAGEDLGSGSAWVSALAWAAIMAIPIITGIRAMDILMDMRPMATMDILRHQPMLSLTMIRRRRTVTIPTIITITATATAVAATGSRHRILTRNLPVITIIPAIITIITAIPIPSPTGPAPIIPPPLIRRTGKGRIRYG